MNKETLLAAGIGVMLGGVFLVINLLFSSFKNADSASLNPEEQVFILSDNSNNENDLLTGLLVMFGFSTDLPENADGNIDKGGDIGNSLAIEGVTVKIVAQSSIDDILHTLLELVTPKEVKRIVVFEGTIVNGFLIKFISNKQLILEKDKKEYTIRLFHPKELNQNRIDNDLK